MPPEAQIAQTPAARATANTPPPTPSRQTRFGPVLYPNRYCWFVLFSALDIMLTHTILEKMKLYNGRELNTFADFVIRHAGLNGAIALKMISVVVVIVITEFVGRRRPQVGNTLINCVVAMSTVPVITALAQLTAVATGHITPAPTLP